MEELSSKKNLSPTDKICENIFSCSTERLFQGRSTVQLPLKHDVTDMKLGDSFELAKRRFLGLEKRLINNKHLYAEYKTFIKEYVDLGHGNYVPLSLSTKDLLNKYFLPHHCGIKEESVSTKLRVVFDASMQSTSGLSLNDEMYKGPTVQPELFDIVCRFRTFKYVMITNIIKMYRQVLIAPEHRHLQNILWCDSPSENLKCIELQTVTYGTNSAPFLTRCLVQLATENVNLYPPASRILLEQRYVDDILFGANNLENLIRSCDELVNLLGSAGFKLHKWISNVSNIIESQDLPSILRKVPNTSDKSELIKILQSITSSQTSIHIDEHLSKVLGIRWQPLADYFQICGLSQRNTLVSTKRNVLAEIASLFDPLGFIGPVVTTGKIIMQQIYVNKLDWDDELPSQLSSEWNKFSKEISHLSKLKIPRLLAWIFRCLN